MTSFQSESSTRSSQVHIRLSDDEKSLLKRASLIKRTTMSDFLRSAIMSAAENIVKQNSNLPYFLNSDGEFVFSAKPRVRVFSCLYNFRDSRRELKEWCDLYGIPPNDFQLALDDIGEGGQLHEAYNDWLDKPEDIEDESF